MSMTVWKRVVVGCLAQVAVLSVVGCGAAEEPAASAESAPEVAPEGVVAGVLVSPELFDLSARWASESETDGGPRAAAIPSAGMDLVSYARLHAPGLVAEATQVQARADREVSAQNTTCTCQVWGTFNSPANKSLSASAWNLSVTGPAHKGRIYQNVSGSKTEHTSSSALFATEFRTRMNCRTPTGANCSVGCTAKMYADVKYSTQLYATADTGGIWDKGSQAQVVDGSTLNWRTPFTTTPQVLFEKAAAVSHYGTSTTFDPKALAELIKSSLKIASAVTQGSITDIGGDLVDSTINSLFGLIHRAGASGSTSQGMIAGFESPFWQPISLNYSSTNNLYYGLDLASDVRMKVRGWGGWHKAEGTVASSYSMAVYMDNFVCNTAGITPPQRTAFWRYDAFDGAPLTRAALQERVGNFLYGGFGMPVNVSANQGNVSESVCGDRVCGGLESAFTCAVDCTICGDKVCSGGETVSSCPGDCGSCGDGICSGVETLTSCRADCGYCGDGFCSTREDSYSCSQDCGGGCLSAQGTSSIIEPCQLQ